MVYAGGRGRRDQPVQGRRPEGRDGADGRHSSDSRRSSHTPAYPHRPASPDRVVDGGRMGIDGPEGLVQPLAEVALVVDSHWRPPSMSSVLCRSVARAREAWLLTVPTEQFSAAAASASVMSIQ